MRARINGDVVIVIAECDEEQAVVSEFADRMQSHVFLLMQQDSRTLRLHDQGPHEIACREPINVSSRSSDAAIRLISNLAHTPFQLDGQEYASVEAFWQGLKFPDEKRRREIATMHGLAARKAGQSAPEAETIQYMGRTIRVGTADHADLMRQACAAKFAQHERARNALRGTGERPLIHRLGHDSRTIPAALMAEIWMRIRADISRKRRHRWH
ncbi:MAG TPA: NADAR domain-containing protein [Candidatus Brocadiia bacterium]|nr:NADAR domain-containing protein [Candidatus Brocadiia bacterium]